MTASIPDPLIGCWRMVRKAGDIADGPVTEFDFLTNTEADLCVDLTTEWMIFQMRWRKEGDVLVFDTYAPGRAPEDRWRFRITEDGELMMAREGGMAWLQRVQRSAPPRQAGPLWKGGNPD
jgi:hypothetical protein